ncbi:hypothetical protein D8S78_12050 [Natrialba swarupiae]|nr:hypothetical protein [Natrialba swarupiae]
MRVTGRLTNVTEAKMRPSTEWKIEHERLRFPSILQTAVRTDRSLEMTERHSETVCHSHLFYIAI